jgi:predicted Zn-dependent protease with MMP-like domain
MMRCMELEHFEELVRRGLDLIPDEIHSRMDNVDIEVQHMPSAQQLSAAGVPHGHTLLGLYVGIPLTRRTSGYNMAMPDRIIIFQGPLERISRNEDALVDRVRDTVIHEVAHHFGISDERLDEIEAERHKKE